GEAVDAGAEPTVEQAAPALEAKTPPSRPKHVGKRPHKPKSKTAPPATLPGFRPDTGTRTVHE
ncbi:MAG: hypothetical protein KC635_21950, partial [Myxococcales bacterium]|nr:hypothetical protein [Myxococcales bacterium]